MISLFPARFAVVGFSVMLGGALLVTPAPLFAQDAIVNKVFYYYNDQAEINSDIRNHDVVVGKDANGNDFGTTDASKIAVTIDGGAQVTGSNTTPYGKYGVSIFNKNSLYIGNALVAGVNGFQSSQVDIVGSGVIYANAYDSSTFNLITDTGSVAYAQSFNESIINTNAHLQQALTYDTGTINITGGNTSRAYAKDNSVITMTGGDLGVAYSYGHSTININTGHPIEVIAHEFGTSNINGGTLFSTYAYDDSIVNVNGGNLTYAIGVIVSIMLFPSDFETAI